MTVLVGTRSSSILLAKDNVIIIDIFIRIYTVYISWGQSGIGNVQMAK